MKNNGAGASSDEEGMSTAVFIWDNPIRGVGCAICLRLAGFEGGQGAAIGCMDLPPVAIKNLFNLRLSRVGGPGSTSPQLLFFSNFFIVRHSLNPFFPLLFAFLLIFPFEFPFLRPSVGLLSFAFTLTFLNLPTFRLKETFSCSVSFVVTILAQFFLPTLSAYF